ncbi:MAG: Stf0 family sulfotransferase [Sphingobium sp.]
MDNAEYRSRRDFLSRAFLDLGIDRCVIVTGSFRAGTTLLCDLLAQNGVPSPGDEKFSHFYQMRAPSKSAAFEDAMVNILKSAVDGLFATKLMWPHRNELAACLGFDRSHARDFAKIFPGARWINVVRSDKIDQSISFWKAKKTNRWHVYADLEAEPELEFDAAGIRKAYAELSIHDDMWKLFHDEAGTSPIEIVYEDFLADMETNVDRLLNNLGAGHAPSPSGRRYKPNLLMQRNAQSERLKQQFLNYSYLTGD